MRLLGVIPAVAVTIISVLQGCSPAGVNVGSASCEVPAQAQQLARRHAQTASLVSSSSPSGLTAKVPRCGEIHLSWNAPADLGGATLKAYNIYRKKVFLTQVAADTTSFVDTGLQSGAYFYYTVAAVDSSDHEFPESDQFGSYVQACQGSGGDFKWARHVGGDLNPDSGEAIAVDREGNVLVTGSTFSTGDIGDGSTQNNGGRDVFVAKYSQDGTPVWSQCFGGKYDDVGSGISTDSNGDVYVVGRFLDTFNFAGTVFTAESDYNSFLIKFSGAGGSPIWWKQMSGNKTSSIHAIAIGPDDNPVVTGQFNGTVDFGGGAIESASAYTQIFLAKYSGIDGSPIWSKQFGNLNASGGFTFGSSISAAEDSMGSVVITGYFFGQVDFGGGPLQSAQSAPNQQTLDVFVAKYNSSGDHVWSKAFGDSNDQHGLAVSMDGNGDVVVTGDFLSGIDFGGGVLPSTQNAQTIFLAKLSKDTGAHLWSKSFVASGLNGGSYAYGVATDTSANIFLTGLSSGPVDLGGGPSTASSGSIFVAKYAEDGMHLWSKVLYGGGGRGKAIAVDQLGNIRATGTFTAVVDFGDGEMRANGGAGDDMFLASLGP